MANIKIKTVNLTANNKKEAEELEENPSQHQKISELLDQGWKLFGKPRITGTQGRPGSTMYTFAVSLKYMSVTRTS